ncbi:MAG: aminotransferase class I/II-fold pyridoxal phosphate-dependent enzyme [Firmicutes bacterium]|nr:aminotransferase class I/II-fold pyridoxal phosphate-dependent enzyme [Bacillota bacterium]
MQPALPAEMPLYVFAALDRRLERRRDRGEEVLDLTKSDPTFAPPAEAMAALAAALRDPEAHRYPPFAGTDELRREIAAWYGRRFGVRLDPDRQVYVTAGSKEGLVHLAQALVRPGEAVLVPDPGFPAYAAAARLAGAHLVPLPLLPEEGHLPDLAAAARRSAAPVRLVYLNYPNNPTGALAPAAYFAAVADWARRAGMWVCHDLAYADIFAGPTPPPSFLAAPHALEVGVETITWSKSYAMQGLRLGAVVGNEDAVAAFAHLESHIMAGVYPAVQRAGAACLREVEPSASYLAEPRRRYRARLERLAEPFARAGWPDLLPAGAVYLWPEAPEGMDGTQFARLLLDEAGVAVTPGSAFGRTGRGRVRLSATPTDAVVDRAADALDRLLGRRRLRPPS